LDPHDKCMQQLIDSQFFQQRVIYQSMINENKKSKLIFSEIFSSDFWHQRVKEKLLSHTQIMNHEAKCIVVDYIIAS
jgi:hypothetical protein